jgi:hypothetical protein
MLIASLRDYAFADKKGDTPRGKRRGFSRKRAMLKRNRRIPARKQDVF